MDVAQFEQSPAGHLVKVRRPSDAAFWAFVPNPLPPKLDLDVGLLRTLSDAAARVGELEGLARTLPNPHIFIQPLIRLEAVVSSRIEGTQTELADLFAYEAGQSLVVESRQDRTESDIREVLEYLREVANYVRAIKNGLARLASLPLSLRLIRELHATLMEGVRGEHRTPGEFRTSPNWIGPPHCDANGATYVPPPPEEMATALDSFEKYLHASDEYPPLVRLAFVHYQFEAIHPFLDGNGRIGRLLLALLLVHWELLSQPLLYLSQYFEHHRDDYYDLLLAVSAEGAWREWVEFFLKGVAEQARVTNDRARALLDLQQEWRERLTAPRASALPLRLVDSLVESPVITIPRAQETLGVGSYHTARNQVLKLEKAGILREVTGESHGKVYVAPQVLRILHGLQD